MHADREIRLVCRAVVIHVEAGTAGVQLYAVDVDTAESGDGADDGLAAGSGGCGCRVVAATASAAGGESGGGEYDCYGIEQWFPWHPGILLNGFDLRGFVAAGKSPCKTTNNKMVKISQLLFLMIISAAESYTSSMILSARLPLEWLECVMSLFNSLMLKDESWHAVI
jgi:hypothetical protein